MPLSVVSRLVTVSYTEVNIKKIVRISNHADCRYLSVKTPNAHMKNVEHSTINIFSVRQYNPNCLLLTGEEAEDCEAARVSGQLDGVPW